MNRKQVSVVAAFVTCAFVVVGCSPPPPASREPISPSTSTSAPSPGSSDGSTSGPTSGPSSSPKPSETATQKPSPRPTEPEVVTPASLVGASRVPEDLRRLPSLPKGTELYRGPAAEPPFADEFGMFVTVEVPAGANIAEATNNYAQQMVAQGWIVDEYYPAIKQVPVTQWILSKGAWIAYVTGQEYKGNKVISLSITEQGNIE